MPSAPAETVTAAISPTVRAASHTVRDRRIRSQLELDAPLARTTRYTSGSDTRITTSTAARTSKRGAGCALAARAAAVIRP
jgi:hypothetical protein